MTGLAEVVTLGKPALLARYGGKLTLNQRNALSAIEHCRDGTFGATLMSCHDCGHRNVRMRSCGHRSCPHCQHQTAQNWLERQQAKLLPVDYFMVTFTLPAALRSMAYRHPERVYAAMFEAVAATLKSFGRRHSTLQADVGFCAVLHTHTRRLDYHPHLHVIIPGGGISRDRGMRLWRTLNTTYLFNGFALAKVFRGKCLAAMNRADVPLPDKLPRKWVAHCQHVGKGLPALKYLSRYLYRGVISERDIVQVDHQTVTFRYRNGKTKRYHRLTLPIADFLWRIALHILPKGLQRVRHFGFLHGNAKRALQVVQRVLRIVLPESSARQPQPFLCAQCGSVMHIGAFVKASPPSG